jgi:hypothetical protein
MIRIEVFQNLNQAAKGREFVAVLEVLERKDNGKRGISICMNFFGTTAEGAELAAASFVASEREREATAKAAIKRGRKRA